jgi:hypothetical protein
MTQESKPIPAPSEPMHKSEATPRAPRQQHTKQSAERVTKSDIILALLSRRCGVSIDEMMRATGWQAHSVRGFLAGTVKKKLGRGVISEAGDKGRIYRIVAETL